MKTIIQNATIVNEGYRLQGSIVMENGHITDIIDNHTTPHGQFDEMVDATGCFVFPGVIDTHVHFREPGLTAKADIESESRAAAFGGVTSYFDMPNTVPQTTTHEALDEKFRLAQQKSHVNYAFFYGATNDNVESFATLDSHRVPGIKLFMGSSTGNMLVDRQEALERMFSQASLPVVAHCEDTAIINRNMSQARREGMDDLPIQLHELIRSEEACYASSFLAVQLAKTYGTRLHVAHVSTARELEMFGMFDHITAEAVVPHLLFTNRDYARLGGLIKCNPSIKSPSDRDALRQALSDGRITTVGTDHAPHLLAEKQGGAVKAVSGMPMVQFSLVAMLGLVDEGVLSLERLVELMCHNPARLFRVHERGFLRRGYHADVVVVRPHASWTLADDMIKSKCGWSPLTGYTFKWRVEHTFCNGHHLYDRGAFDASPFGEEIRFDH